MYLEDILSSIIKLKECCNKNDIRVEVVVVDSVSNDKTLAYLQG